MSKPGAVSYYQDESVAIAALQKIVSEYDLAQAMADDWEASGGHVGMARYERAVLQGLGIARDIALRALAAIPSCDQCGASATQFTTSEGSRWNWCDVHAPSEDRR